MRGVAERIRALLGSGDEAQRAQGRELLAALGDGALYVEVLAGWTWEQSYNLAWRGSGESPLRQAVATDVWVEAPLEAPFPPALALDAVAELEFTWRGLASQRAKLAALPRLWCLSLVAGDGDPPLAALPRGLRDLALQGFDQEDLAGLAAPGGVMRLSLSKCALGAGPLPLPPRLRWLALLDCEGELELAAALAGIPLRRLELDDPPNVGSLAALQGLLSLGLRRAQEGLPPGIGALRGLLALELRVCGLADLPPLDLPRLRRLDLSFNPLEELPPALAGLRELRHLDLLGTRLRALPPWLPALRRLESLNLAASLPDLPIEVDLLLRLPHLRILHVNDYHLEPAERLAERAAKEQGRCIEVRLL